MEDNERSKFYQEHNLGLARTTAAKREPASHQYRALERLDAWYRTTAQPSGGILVLPTGGGKTFTALRFLCKGPLSDGYKVLWLAHTHHLLEQAFESCGSSVGQIAEPKRELRARVVSGTPGHWPVSSIAPDDDFVVATLQTIALAHSNKHPALSRFLKATSGKLLVVFDEAHHSPAPTYRKLIEAFRRECPQMKLLGLTATPTYSDPQRQGWLLKLFPQNILFQVTPNVLMADGILAKPHCETQSTDVKPDFSEADYRKWLGTYQDLPESIVGALAENKARNECIANTYVENKRRYGKTIIFADRWYQCEHIAEALKKRGVRAGSVYSQVEHGPATVAGRNRRSRDENAKVLAQFREGNLDVLLNVKMLTEGTDVPKVQTVFLTRQTTSKILLTQMIGRALRGPKFGGTADAYIVSFVDDWQKAINWAEYDPLVEGAADEATPEFPRRPPVQLISIDLVRQLAQQLDSGSNVAPSPFLTLLPLGWYQVEYDALAEGSEDVEKQRRLILVFEGQEGKFRDAITQLATARSDALASESARLADHRDVIERTTQEFFAEMDNHPVVDMVSELFHIARHVAQADGQPPRFFPFEARTAHDLDAIAAANVAADLGPSRVNEALKIEYGREDRYWRDIYHRFDLFKSQYDGVVNRLLLGDVPTPALLVSSPAVIPPREPPEDVKRAVAARDGHRCLACGDTRRQQADHVISAYMGGSISADNLQTLCGTCNRLKGVQQIDFRDGTCSLKKRPAFLGDLDEVGGGAAVSPADWERLLRRLINFYYQCGAVEHVDINESKGEWTVRLRAGNDPEWMSLHVALLVKRIKGLLALADMPGLNRLEVTEADSTSGT